MSELLSILTELANAFGPSGFESEPREVFRKWLETKAEFSYDNLGSCIAVHRGPSPSPRILLAAHLDEVGLLVRGILPSGYLKVVPLGSWWAPSLLAQKVVIRSANGDHHGVVGAKPPHFLSDEEQQRLFKLKDLYIDVGARSKEEAESMGIQIGDPMVPAVNVEPIGKDEMFAGKAFDDRAGCAVMIQILREIADHPNTIYAAGTVQEENGLKGANTVAAAVQPDVAIVLEGTPADDFPDAGGVIQGRLGGGPQIRWLDPTMIANPALLKLAVETAKELQIPFQEAVREGGGTDAKEIQIYGAGVPILVIGVPVRYAHSHHGIVHLGDLRNTVKLVKAMIMKMNQETVAAMKQNPW